MANQPSLTTYPEAGLVPRCNPEPQKRSPTTNHVSVLTGGKERCKTSPVKRERILDVNADHLLRNLHPRAKASHYCDKRGSSKSASQTTHRIWSTIRTVDLATFYHPLPCPRSLSLLSNSLLPESRFQVVLSSRSYARKTLKPNGNLHLGKRKKTTSNPSQALIIRPYAGNETIGFKLRPPPRRETAQ